MTKKQALVGALIFYLLVLALGGAAYFFMPQLKAAVPALANRGVSAEELERRQAEAAAKKAAREAEEAKRKAEEEEKQAREKAAREKEWAAQKQRDDKIEQLTASMRETVRNGVTIYTYPKELSSSSGVHLRPFLMRGYDGAVLKNEIYYYYSIYDNIPTNWIHGDGLTVQADGQNFYLKLNPEKRRDHLASNAESLTERYVSTADKQTLDMLHAVAQAGNVTLYYYKTGGEGCTSNLSREELRHIRDMVQLYDLLNQSDAAAENY